MTDKKFLYYTRFYPACSKCGMRENIVSKYEFDDHYCRVCACIILRNQNNKKDEKEKEDENVMFNKLEIKRPPLVNKCVECYNPPVSYCRHHIWSMCEEHQGLELSKIEGKCKIYEKEDIWKSCYWWESICKEHEHRKKYYCKADNKMYCLVCFYRSHLKCNKKEISNELEEIDKYLDESYINKLYDKLIKEFPEDPILKMIDDNKGIRSIYIIKQLRYFMDSKPN